ncbi:MAG: HD domain-containing protein, partial [Gaiellales bacterium]
METVSFTAMADGTREDYKLLDRYADEYARSLPDRLLAALEGLKESYAGYQVNRYEHSLQSATHALRDGKSEEYVVAALLHDLGDELAPWTHGEMAAAILRPFVPEDVYWAVKH